MYNTTLMLRTMGLLLGLESVTHLHAGARPMAPAFQTAPDPRPYTAEKPRIGLDEHNPARSATVARSLALDFSDPGRVDDNELNAILWGRGRARRPRPPSGVTSPNEDGRAGAP